MKTTTRLRPQLIATSSLLILELACVSGRRSGGISDRHITERTFWSDSSNTLEESFLYNEPHSVDEEFQDVIRIKFAQPLDRLVGTVIELSDTSIVHARYDRSSPWNLGEDIVKITGSILFSELHHDWLRVDQHIQINGDAWRLNGKRRIARRELKSNWPRFMR